MLEVDEREALKMYKRNTPLEVIAEKLGLPLSRIMFWKDKTDWKNYNTKVGEPGHINTVGVGVGMGPGFGNKNRVEHGLKTQWIPEEMMEIINDTCARKPIDILWDNILIQHAAIVRAQNIMYVRDIEDNIELITKEADSFIERDVQYSWDRYRKYLAAQAGAMDSLNKMIVSYERLIRQDKADEEQALRIQKLKRELETSRSVEDKMQQYFEALSKAVSEDDR